MHVAAFNVLFTYLIFEIILLPISVNKQETVSTNTVLELRTAAEQLHVQTWLLLTAYRNLPTSYPMVPSPTPYDIPLSHSTKRYR